MVLTKITFRDLSEEETSIMLSKLRELDLKHDIEVIDLDDGWKQNETASALYKAYRKAKGAFKEFVINNKF
jgi:hypothetical protein